GLGRRAGCRGWRRAAVRRGRRARAPETRVGPHVHRRHPHGGSGRRGAARPAPPRRRWPCRAGAGRQQSDRRARAGARRHHAGLRRRREDRSPAQGRAHGAGRHAGTAPPGGTYRSGIDEGTCARRTAAPVPEAFGPAAARAAGDHGGLGLSDSMLSRRVSELVGVVLFGVTLIWLIALASYSPSDPVWFFNAGAGDAPANFAGRVGAFAAEASFQLLGYAAYLMPAILAVVGWHYFWCRELEAEYTKTIGGALLVASVATLLSLAFGSLAIEGTAFRAGGYVGEAIAGGLAEYLNRTGSTIVVMTVLVLSAGLATQLSIGRAFSLAGASVRERGAGLAVRFRSWRDERRREKQRADVIRKHTEKAGPDKA